MTKDLFDELDQPAGDVSATATCANVQPKVHNTKYKIAIIGDSPGKDEIQQNKPFVGFAGKELDRFLSRFGIVRDACFVGNICQHQPPGNNIANFEWNGPEIQGGIRKLTEDLKKFQPNICLLLGGAALHVAMCGYEAPKKGKDKKDGLKFLYPHPIGDWRGSFFLAPPYGFDEEAPFVGLKCIASYHPAACLRNYSWTPLLMMDIQRMLGDALGKDLVLPKRDLMVELSFERICHRLDDIILRKPKVGTDIEGYWNFLRCISFAEDPAIGFNVPFVNMGGQSLWSIDEECALLYRVAKLLADPRIIKVWQNGLYDRFCLQYGYNIIVRGISEDIMLKHWELYCELEKALSVQTSIYTREPFYKAEIKADDIETFSRYCCKDSAVTLEIDQKIDKYLPALGRKHYEFDRTLLNALLYMELRGLKYNKEGATVRLKNVNQTIYELQHKLDSLTGYGCKTTDKTLLRAMLRDTMCYKRDTSKVKKGYENDFDINMRTLLGEGTLSPAELGRLSTAMGVNLNTKGDDLKDYLYETLGLPKQYHHDTGSLTSNYEALITLRKKSSHATIELIIDIGELRTRAQMLEIATDPDGRVRSSYNEVGTETGRVTSQTSPTGSGYNMQTIPDENELKPKEHHLREGMRDLIMADDGCYLAKCDLKGADGWTVGANLAALGDSTMLDDLRFGLKPASILCYARRHGVQSIQGKGRPELMEMCKEVKKHDWDYFAYKQCIWGFCYLMGVRKATQHVFNVSEGTVTVPESEMELAKNMLFRRYNIPLWHKATEKRLLTQPYPPKLTSPSGHTRMFFGRRQEILGEALADEPQEVTTYATNMAVFNCWNDPENRVRECDGSCEKTLAFPICECSGKIRLRIEPMHQVHDEFLVQFRIEDLDFAKKKIAQWFNNPIRIAGIEVTIPYDGAYGTDWSMGDKSKVGNI